MIAFVPSFSQQYNRGKIPRMSASFKIQTCSRYSKGAAHKSRSRRDCLVVLPSYRRGRGSTLNTLYSLTITFDQELTMITDFSKL